MNLNLVKFIKTKRLSRTMNYHSRIKVYKNHLGQQHLQRKKECVNK